MYKQRAERLTGALGIVAMPLLIGGAALSTAGIPDEDAADSEFVAHFADKQSEIWAGAILTLAGVVALVGFIAGLRAILRDAEREPSGLSAVVFGAGVAVALFTLVGPTLAAGVAGSVDFFDFALAPDTAQLLLGVTWLPSIYAGLAAAVVIGATSLSSKRTGVLPSIIVRAGYVVAPLALVASVPGLALPLFALWAVTIGVALSARSRRQEVRRPMATDSIAQPG